MKMVLIPAGTFKMGSPGTYNLNAGGSLDEYPQHQVTISQSFYLGKYEVTQAQWQAIMGTNPSFSYHKGDNRPVDQVSWDDCQTFCQKVSSKTGWKARLPTEAEWEYACRAGTTTTYYLGDDASQLPLYAWYEDNSGYDSHDVGGKLPNAWGLYDMSGNVWEWCQDWYGDYSAGSQSDPTGPSSEDWGRVLRGGSWYDVVGTCRVTTRGAELHGYNGSNHFGLRLAMDSK